MIVVDMVEWVKRGKKEVELMEKVVKDETVRYYLKEMRRCLRQIRVYEEQGRGE